MAAPKSLLFAVVPQRQRVERVLNPPAKLLTKTRRGKVAHRMSQQVGIEITICWHKRQNISRVRVLIIIFTKNYLLAILHYRICLNSCTIENYFILQNSASFYNQNNITAAKSFELKTKGSYAKFY
jgi:hypothetical protein